MPGFCLREASSIHYNTPELEKRSIYEKMSPRWKAKDRGPPGNGGVKGKLQMVLGVQTEHEHLGSKICRAANFLLWKRLRSYFHPYQCHFYLGLY